MPLTGMQGMTFDWRGAEVEAAFLARLDEEMANIGRTAVQVAQTYAPKRTGRLAMSIHFVVDHAQHSVEIAVGAPYGIFVEYGTRYMRPQPYLRPALNALGPIFGIQLDMAFNSVPMIHTPILAAGAGFHLPSTLTHKQLGHVRKHLLPTSKRHHIGNVSRAKLKVRKF